MGKITILELAAMKERGEKITMLTAYDYAFAKILDACGVDVLLVGDSVGPVVQGVKNTLPVTLEQMIYHTQMAARGRERALLVFDLPFMSYQESLEQARRNAGRAVKETGAEAVKLEGGENAAETIAAIVKMDVPVMAHIGLTPQSVHRMGGFKVQGRDPRQAEKILADARAVEQAGAFAVVLECIPAELAAEVTRTLAIPTIGIGSGVNCDGQVLVIHDLLGLYTDRKISFVKQYVDLNAVIVKAVANYLDEVRGGAFPTAAHSFSQNPAAAGAPAKKGARRKN